MTFEDYDRALPPWEPAVKSDEDWLLLSKKQDSDPEIDPILQTFAKHAQPRQQPFDPSQRREDSAISDIEKKASLATAIDENKVVSLGSNAEVDEQSKKIEMFELHSKLYLRPGMEQVALNLDHVGRKLIFRGDLQLMRHSTWRKTHVILLDHYLVLAQTVSRVGKGKSEVYDVFKLPIPMELLVLESTNDDPVLKSSVKGVGAVTTGAKSIVDAQNPRLNQIATNDLKSQNALEYAQSNNSMSIMSSVRNSGSAPSNDADAMLMYPFRLQHLGQSHVYTLCATSAQNRQDWCNKIVEAKTHYSTTLSKENSEPFRLRVIADSAFAYDSISASQHSVVSVKGTPLDQALREIERIYGSSRQPPRCRAEVNCAATFNYYGRSLVVIGTDYGVYISEANDPRGWARCIQISRVTQIGILEQFSICLLIADKSLIAYHLDIFIRGFDSPTLNIDSNPPVPQKLSGARDVSFFAIGRMKERTLVFYKKREGLHSTFTVLEPVFVKSSEKKSRSLFDRMRSRETTEFFREFDKFYIPTECLTINLFNEYIAISTSAGFELLTLDKKVLMAIPDLKNPAIKNIAARLANQKPLGMFRLSDLEFLLCFEEISVYVDKHGEVSRSVVMEYEGKAKAAVLYGVYLVLFNSDFVEVRNAENGRLRQVITGRDVKPLDYGISPLGANAATSQSNLPGNSTQKRTLKLAMAHPEVATSRIVLEMVLKDDDDDNSYLRPGIDPMAP
ncbi:CNH domain-containing protein [Cadophora sp. MPI-SDFR-AT-0126]|nr:CNH domain-containing protein [Leotiomycetes sp. MPI-SDFR-AT-0126]